ncbi:MAG: class I SAM-dependent methyltransferase [Ktedonobacterales bacterium]|nr:class I SAM-dependent methyltransferase [Ktedonobacterales bacterium]
MSDHVRDAQRFLSSGSSLRPIERAEVGDVTGKTLLHPQCNRGSDTLSWARLGAIVTGVDFAEVAIERAQALARAAQLDARFLCSDLFALPNVLDERFDIVFTSYGVLCWIPDLTRWAEIMARYLRPGGVFYLVDTHPFASLFTSDAHSPTGVRVHPDHPYASCASPWREELSLPATAGQTSQRAALSTWSHGLGEIVTALLAAGLRLAYLHEHPATFYQQFPTLIHGEDELWRWPDPTMTLPLLFSLRATKA